MRAKPRPTWRAAAITMAASLGATALALGPASPAHADPACQDGGFYVLWARGSGQGFNADEAMEFKNHVYYALDTAGLGPHEWAELGNLDGNGSVNPGYEYPAAGFPWLDPLYGSSVATGTDELVIHLNDRYAGDGPTGSGPCTNETAIIGGYSQGADVIGWALERNGGPYVLLSQAAKDRIGYAAFYGDPKMDALGTHDSSKWWIRGNPPYYSMGILGNRSPYAREEFRGRVGSWCDQGDGICNYLINPNYTNWGNHMTVYRDWWIWQSAAQVVLGAATHACEGSIDSSTASYSDSSGAQHVYVTTCGGINHYVKPSGGSWSGEVVIADTFTSAPAAYVDSSGKHHVYVTDSGGLHHYVKSGGTWDGEVVAGASFISRPAAYVDSTGKHHVYLTTSSGLRHYAKTTGSWGGEIIAGGSFTSSPAVYVDGSTHHVYLTTSGDIRHYAKSTGSWGGEIIASCATCNSNPSAYKDFAGVHRVLITTTGGLNHYAKSTGGWGGEVIATGSFTSSPAGYRTSGGTQHVYVTTSSGLKRYGKNTGGWSSQMIAYDDDFNSSPSAFANSTGHHIYVTTSGGINHYLNTSGSWGGEVVANL